MVERRLAMTVDQRITYCTAPLDKIGQGRCNHICHQGDNQTPKEFLEKMEPYIIDPTMSSHDIETRLDPTLLDPRSTTKRLGLRTDLDDDVQDQQELIENVVQKFAHPTNPKWDNIVKEIDDEHPIDIGKVGTEDYERAKLIKTEEVHHEYPSGDTIETIATYEVDGREYTMSWGEVPLVNKDGTLKIDGVKWRFLPVLNRRKAGLQSTGRAVFTQQEDGNMGFALNYKSKFINDKGEEDYMIKTYNQTIPWSKAHDYIFGKWDGKDNGDGYKLLDGPKYGLKHLDKAIFQRFPNLEKDRNSIINLPADEINDFSWRRFDRYQDVIKNIMVLQSRRIATTFRRNMLLQKQHPEMSQEEKDEKYPLFIQHNLTGNIKRELVGRSNVQFADNLNPFAALSQSNKIALVGKGQINKDTAPKELRLPHKSHFGLIDGMDCSTGGNVGLTATLSGGYIGEDRMLHKKPETEDQASIKDFVPYINHNNPARNILSEAHLKQSVPIVGGEDPLCKTPAWDNLKGAKLGVNLRVAYIPSVGTFEDAVTISESTALKMATKKKKEYIIEKGQPINVKQGQQLHRKDKIGKEDIRLDSNVLSMTTDHEGNTHVVVETNYPMSIGDKISGFSGNKGTVAKIIPDGQMPKMKNPEGLLEPVQIIMSPMGVGGRRNISQIMEANENMDGHENVKSTREVDLPDGHKIDASGGVAYIHRLNHLADDILSSVQDEKGITREPKAGRVEEMQSIMYSYNDDRYRILNYLRDQTHSDVNHKLDSLFKSIGVDVSGIGLNLEDDFGRNKSDELEKKENKE